MTDASRQALVGLRDWSTMQWYAIPLLAIVLYIYAVEIKKARQTGDWNAIFAGLTLFGLDFINETWNGWVFHFTQYSAMWTAPGPTALHTMMGWNLEIMFMFAIAGIIFYHTLSGDPKVKILGLPEGWFWAIVYSAFCVLVECLLNLGGRLIWAYQLWDRTFQGVWLIFLFGYFTFFAGIQLVIHLKTNRQKITAISCIYGVAVAANIFGMGIMGWRY